MDLSKLSDAELEAIASGKGAVSSMSDVQLRAIADRPTTLQQRAQSSFGIDPKAERNTLLPLYRTDAGKYEMRWPSILSDPLTSFLLPGHTLKGGSFTPEDVTKFALDFGVNPKDVRVTGKTPMTRREFVEAAPNAEQLQKSSRAAYDAARQSGLEISAKSGNDLYFNLFKTAVDEGVDATLHPNATAFIKRWGDGGGTMSLRDLETMRRHAGIVAGSKVPDEARIGQMFKDAIDDFVDALKPTDAVSGDPAGVGKALETARAMWQRSKKVDMMDTIIERAMHKPSGFENGIRIEVRKILDNPAKVRGFTADEKAAMEAVAQGGPVANFLRLAGKFGFGSKGSNSWLGGTVTTLAANELGGPGAAVAAPMVGKAAQMGAARQTEKALEAARATMAIGGTRPPLQSNPAAFLQRLLGPLAGTKLDPYKPEIDPLTGRQIF